jgi:adenine C2-methylase RlmN of 23S rRNA A2503 and tRNA A37
LENFYRLADFLDIKLKCNYLLLNYPWWWNNYSEKHLQQLISILDPKRAKIKLTKYSETWKGFSSPDQLVFEKIKNFLQDNNFEVGIRDILWEDLWAACGMLDYQN